MFPEKSTDILYFQRTKAFQPLLGVSLCFSLSQELSLIPFKFPFHENSELPRAKEFDCLPSSNFQEKSAVSTESQLKSRSFSPHVSHEILSRHSQTSFHSFWLSRPSPTPPGSLHLVNNLKFALKSKRNLLSASAAWNFRATYS